MSTLLLAPWFYHMLHYMFMTLVESVVRMRGQEVGQGTGMPEVFFHHEMGNPNEKTCSLSPKTHELFGQLCIYPTC